MTAADRIDRQFAKLLVADADGAISHLPRAALASLFRPGDLVVANDAATLPASLQGVHRPTGEPIEARLAGWVSFRDPCTLLPSLSAQAIIACRPRIALHHRRFQRATSLKSGPLVASVERLLDHPRLVRVRFAGSPASVMRGLVRHGRPIQYAHIPEPLRLWDVWTKIAADPIAFESPSAGLALDWRILKGWRERGVAFATLSHAAGLSSAGDAALDRRLPFDEFYRIPEACASAIEAAKSRSGRVIAIGTSVVRALESAANANEMVCAGEGQASGRIARGAPLRVVDAILTGVHQPGESHCELLRAFADDRLLDRVRAAVEERGYRAHEFGLPGGRDG